jgi:dipeptidase E
MKMLLTSAGIRNPSIHNALVELLGKPIAECRALCIPTATYAFPGGAVGAKYAWQFISGQEPETPMCELGWKSLGVLEPTALPSLDRAVWVPMVQETDVLLVNGGDTLYLAYWMRQSGLADLFPSLRTVYVGLSAGSVVMAPTVAQEFVHWKPPTSGPPTSGPPTSGNLGLGLVDFVMFPHLDHPSMPAHSLACAEKWAAGLTVPGYAMDDETAIKVVDGSVEVVSEGHWKLFTPGHAPTTKS